MNINLIRSGFKWASIIIAGFIFISFIIFPAITAFYATRSARSTVGDTPSGYQDVNFVTADNVRLAAWYKEPQNGAVIVLVHGASSSRESMKSYMEILTKHNFGILAMDLRGHGESEGQTNRLGWQGTKDIAAAVEFLKTKPEVKAIGGLGTSLGGEVLLGSASKLPEMKAITSEGATYRSFEEFYDYHFTSPFIQNISTIKVQDFFISITKGEKPPQITILQSIKQSDTKLLLIAAGNVQKEIDYNNLFKNSTNDRAQLWIIEDSGHVGGLSKNANEYESKVVSFFNDSLLSD